MKCDRETETSQKKSAPFFLTLSTHIIKHIRMKGENVFPPRRLCFLRRGYETRRNNKWIFRGRWEEAKTSENNVFVPTFLWQILRERKAEEVHKAKISISRHSHDSDCDFFPFISFMGEIQKYPAVVFGKNRKNGRWQWKYFSERFSFQFFFLKDFESLRKA